MDFQTSVKTCLTKYVDFTGRATRSEYWWFALFCFVVTVIIAIFSRVVSDIISLIFLLPSLAVLVRRLHDTSRSGWWALLLLIPIIGPLVLLYFAVLPSSPGANTYGA
jgi:uncharacterized membrane protein YhaH (DUF805 family)